MPCRSVGSAFGPPRNPSPPLGDNDGHHGHTPTRKHPSSLEEVPRGNIHDPELPCDFSVLLRGLTQHRAEYRQLPAGLPRRNGLGIAARVHRTLPHGRRAAYTVVKRIGIPEYIRKLGGAGLWLNIHIVMSLVGFFAILIHAGFPFQFRSSNLWSHGFAALATWLLLVTTISGVFGRYLYRHLPAFKRAFAIWKPTHLVVTALFFVFALAHVWIETMGGG